jgi:superkiller protein 3
MVAPISFEEKDLANQHLDRSISFAMCGKLDQAIDEARKAVKLDPEFAQAYNKLGDYLIKKGQVNEAVAAYRKSIDLNPEHQNSHFDLGCSLAMLGEYDAALDSLNHAFELKPSHSEIHCHIGRIHLMKGEISEAIDRLNQALAANPDDIMACFTLACAYNHKGMHDDAEKLFKKVISRYMELVKVKTGFAEGHYYMGRSYFLLGDKEKAVENLLKAVEYDTEAIDYHYSFGMLYSDADAFCSLAEAQYDLGQYDEARSNLKRAIELEPNNKRFNDLKSSIGI